VKSTSHRNWNIDQDSRSWNWLLQNPQTPNPSTKKDKEDEAGGNPSASRFDQPLDMSSVELQHGCTHLHCAQNHSQQTTKYTAIHDWCNYLRSGILEADMMRK